MKIEKHNIKVNEKADINSVWLIPEAYQSVLIIAHGAGNDMHSEFVSYLHETIAQSEILTIKFNFPYMQQGRKAPDRAQVLEATWNAVINDVIEKTQFGLEQVFLSGKSMGGRYASIIAAQRAGFGGLILYGYPLHPPGKPEKLRADHLALIQCPMLFIEGTRDSLCKLNVLKPILNSLQPNPELHIIDGGDHSFKVLKKLNRSPEEVWEEIARHSIKWIMQQ